MKSTSPIDLKHVRTIDAVAKTRSIARAAQVLNSTQPVVSRSIAAADAYLGRAVFQRGWGGTELTGWGELVLHRCAQALKLIAGAERDLTGHEGPSPNFVVFLRWHHLDAVAAVARFGTTLEAATQLGVTQPAISRAISALSGYAHHTLFVRRRSGLEVTPEALRLARLGEDLHRELDDIQELSTSTQDGLVGRLAVGMLPFSGQDLVAKAFGNLTNQHPDLRLMALPASYDMLADALMRGEIDCIIGILRYPAKYAELEESFLYHEKYTLVARQDHPCHSQQQNILSLRSEKWMVAQHGTPIRTFFESLFENEGAVPPAQTCVVHSFAQAEQVIINSDSIGLLAYSDTHLRRMNSDLRKVNIDLPGARVDIGLTTRKQDNTSEILRVFAQTLRQFIE